MRRRALTAAVMLTAGALTQVVPQPPAQADPTCAPGTEPHALPTGTICIPAADPGTPGAANSGPATGPSSTGVRGCTYNGGQVPCVTAQGTWSSAHECYAQVVAPQPQPGRPEWEGHDASEGSVWQCVRPGVTEAWLYFFVPTGATPTLVDAGSLAQEALGTMTLAAPTPHTAPAEETLVGLDTWLWVDDYQPIQQAVTAGSTTITVTAEPDGVEWSTPEGRTACSGAGRPWTDGLPASADSDCTAVFKHVSTRRPGGTLPLVVNAVFHVTWTCSGACTAAAGDLGDVDGQPAQTAIRVVEQQSLVVR